MKKNGLRNARFWVLGREANDVKLTLREGQSVEWTWGCTHEEGWHRETHYWTYEDGVVTYVYDSCGTDCDGRVDHSSVAICPVEQLKAHEFDGMFYPKWERSCESYRDYEAEKAGY